MPPALFAAFFCTTALGIVTSAILIYEFSGRRPEARFALVVSLLLIAGLFALSPLLFIASDKNARAAFEKKVRAYAQAQERQGNQSPEILP